MINSIALNNERVLYKYRYKELWCRVKREFALSGEWDPVESRGKEFRLCEYGIVFIDGDFLECGLLDSNISNRDISLLILNKVDSKVFGWVSIVIFLCISSKESLLFLIFSFFKMVDG